MSQYKLRFNWIFVFLLVSGAAPYHGIYLSITDISPSVTPDKWDVELKIFTDDLEDALDHFCGDRMALHNPNSSEMADSILPVYLSKHLKFTMNHQSVNLKYEKFTLLQDATMIQCELTFTGALNHISVENTILVDLFSNQKNVVRISNQGKQRILPFDKRNTKGVMEWE